MITWQQRSDLARHAKAGDKWRQIKSGRIATVMADVESGFTVTLKHENGRTTRKWRHYFAQQFEPCSTAT